MINFKKLVVMLLVVAMVAALGGCGDTAGGSSGATSTPDATTDPTPPEGDAVIDKLGISIALPESYKEHYDTLILISAGSAFIEDGVLVNGQAVVIYQPQEVYDRLLELSSQGRGVSEEEYASILEQIRVMAAITSVQVASLEPYLAQGDDISIITAYENNDVIGDFGGSRFYLSYGSADTSGMSEASAELYTALFEDMDALKAGISFFTPAVAEQLYGVKIGQNIASSAYLALDNTPLDATAYFKEHKITLVNCWATYCDFCIAEMPDIERLHKEFGDLGLGVLGICLDTDAVDANAAVGLEILADNDVTYPNAAVNDFVLEVISPYVSYLPTTFFVDENGVVISEFIVGVAGYGEFKNIIENLLAE